MKFSQSFEVRFSEVDHHSQITPISLFNYLQETAIGHGDAVGMDGGSLTDMGYAWMMNRIHIEIDRYPLRREAVTVQTWGSNLRGLYAIREWRVTDAQDAVLARATARWIMLNIAKKKIIKIPSVIPERYGEHADRSIDDPFHRMIPIEDGGNERRFHVRRSEIDSNQHANSACYIDWCLEAVPEDMLLTHLPRSIEITFKKETKLGDSLVSKSIEPAANEAGDRMFDHAIWREGDSDLITMGKTIWRETHPPQS